ncbi:MAG: hypothetical protein KME49_21015 [Brasilonema octagenarum HA4186-MV1]|jgi:hypothetical protein|uniref:Uncharacterized protein n=1 Tax=Brasilonema sennae CENA114 TaxID=415709 RepID=A0A856MHV5_9CYAN|nr:hypothetical protein [Brasilonema sennae]MBW4627918.1 hypothetical protein [Brasilonema octagenarum HA4186-MV1]QDL08707.1 hypothetical protein DP114_13130 [Brasilonema sennae CENA114]QDL15063.1 hypothetical protein DP113_13070 [Brasilonema octagenarum UFV-E1]
MKSKLLSLGLFSLTAVSPFFIPSLTPSASAGCVGVTAGTQIAISREARQSTRVNRQSSPGCSGSTSVSTGKQVCINNDGACEQRRTVNQNFEGGNRRGGYDPVKDINVDVNVPVHVKSPRAPFSNR